jgi:hypothetical protein
MGAANKSSAADSFGEIATVRIELVGTDPVIWRQVEAPTSITLKVLRDIIQATMGWFDHHLWEFTVGKQRYGLPMDEDLGTEKRKRAATVRLRDVLTATTMVLDYMYDFGDGWEHRITVTDVRPGDPDVSYPRHVGGEHAGPPEDCGGVLGFYELLQARADPDHPDHAEAREWLDDYDGDPNIIDELPIKYALGRIASRRNAAKARIAKEP